MNGYECPCCTAFIGTHTPLTLRECGTCRASAATQQVARLRRAAKLAEAKQ